MALANPSSLNGHLDYNTRLAQRTCNDDTIAPSLLWETTLDVSQDYLMYALLFSDYRAGFFSPLDC